jgi:tetratricopeptide (TPR) repeat protein
MAKKDTAAARRSFLKAGLYYDSARMNFENAVKWNPKYSDPYNNLGAFYGTLAQNMRGNGNEKAAMENFSHAIYNFKMALAIEPDKPGPYYSLGMTYANMNRSDSAQYYNALYKQMTGQ